MIGPFKVEGNMPPLSGFVTGPYVGLVQDLENCSKGAPCADCKQPKAWNCDWKLMERAKRAIEELLQLHHLDQSEIVRLRRQIEVLQMEAEK